MKRMALAFWTVGMLALGTHALAADNDPVETKERWYRGSKDSLGYIRKSNGPWAATVFQNSGYDKTPGYGPYAGYQDPAIGGHPSNNNFMWSFYWPRAPRYHPPYTGIYTPGIHYGYGPYNYTLPPTAGFADAGFGGAGPDFSGPAAGPNLGNAGCCGR